MKATRLLAIVFAVVGACSGGDASRHAAASDSGAKAAGAVVTGVAFISAASYVGIRYDSLPAPFAFEAGALMPKAPGAVTAAFDLDRVRTPRGEMVWLDSIVVVPGRGRPDRIVRAELKVPPLAADERLVLASCDAGGRLDPHIVAIVVVEPGATRSTQIRQAWRADAASGVFEVISVTGVTCDEPGS
jgi:hypothetical protein